MEDSPGMEIAIVPHSWTVAIVIERFTIWLHTAETTPTKDLEQEETEGTEKQGTPLSCFPRCSLCSLLFQILCCQFRLCATSVCLARIGQPPVWHSLTFPHLYPCPFLHPG